jgi:hypothetical protein
VGLHGATMKKTARLGKREWVGRQAIPIFRENYQ